ncbi:MAG: alanyl-tRNA synthetase [Chitinophagaceae bacterium]|nr:alanyl-tRNA synthetase [Chitinophagaceae bacterium]
MEMAKDKRKIITWIKRIGFWGFMFFLLKGLVWLAIGYFIVR